MCEPLLNSIDWTWFSINRRSYFIFSKTVLWLFQIIFFKKFLNFSSLSDLARQHFSFFVVFFHNFCKVFLPQGRYDYSIPPFCFIFMISCIFFMHLRDIFGPLYFWDFFMIQALFSEIDHWLLMGYWYIHDWYWLIWSIWGFVKN